MQVATFLEHHGFTNIINISGGIQAWSDQVDASVPVY
jgi:rhodanese-related sulfurtransferase